ncbi:MAG: tetratricopeptide repeat protein, partial [Elainellaceae cyanobacterium]
MIDQVATAIKQRNYAQAHHLLQPLLKEQPHNPWVQLYAGQLHELSNRPDSARAVYHQLLQMTPNRQVLGQARRGLERLAAAALPAQRPVNQGNSIGTPAAQPITTAAEAILVLQPAPDRDRAVEAFSQLMAIDRYTAKTQLPRRGWRFHSVGELDALRCCAQQLQQAGIPARVLPLQTMQHIHVFRVKTFQQLQPPSVLCESATGQLGRLAFAWQDVAQCVDGRLPIFEDVVDVDSRKRLMRKEKTQDYA